VIGALKGTLEWAFGNIEGFCRSPPVGLAASEGILPKSGVSSMLKKAGFVDCSTFW
jgi:hypothetical protein